MFDVPQFIWSLLSLLSNLWRTVITQEASILFFMIEVAKLVVAGRIYGVAKFTSNLNSYTNSSATFSLTIYTVGLAFLPSEALACQTKIRRQHELRLSMSRTGCLPAAHWRSHVAYIIGQK